jgi:predicted nucleic acid-binding protein
VTRFVVDPPALIDFLREGRRLAEGHQLVAPNAIRSQALGLLLVGVRDGEMSEREALALHERMTELKMRLLGDRVSRRAAWDLAREHEWDELRHAEYLAITRLQADALVAGDPELARRATGLVTLAPASALTA